MRQFDLEIKNSYFEDQAWDISIELCSIINRCENPAGALDILVTALCLNTHISLNEALGVLSVAQHDIITIIRENKEEEDI